MFSGMQDRRVMVTGSAKGIGKGIAEAFASRGARVFLADLSAEHVEATGNAFRAKGYNVAWGVADVKDKASVEQVASKAVEQLGRLDVLCANAGIFPAAPLETMTEEQWDTVLDVNLKGMFLTVQACIPALKESTSGRIVVTSSITGPVTGYPGWCHYGASKAGQMGFIRTAAIELARYGITINAVQPGNIATEGLQEQGEAYMASMASSIPLRRLGLPADIAAAAVFLASPDAGYITGQGIIVDGGQILPETLEALDA